MNMTMIPAFTSRSLRGVLLLLAFTSEAFCFASPPLPPASGVLTNSAMWFDAADASRAAQEFGEGRYSATSG
jgi:hypothetical protein